MKETKILVFGTDIVVVRLLKHALSTNDYKVVGATPETEVMEEIARHKPVLLFLDDLSICIEVRQQWQRLPLILFGSKYDERLAIRALEQGADDYVAYPFALDELAARVRALLRRTQKTMPGESEPEILRSKDGYLRMNVTRHEVFVGERKVQLTKTEFALLQELMANAEKVLSHRILLRNVWGPEYGDEEHYLRVYVRYLRRKIEEDPSRPLYIRTEPGVGYVFRSLCPGTET